MAVAVMTMLAAPVPPRSVITSEFIDRLRVTVGNDGLLTEREELLVYECDGYTIEKSLPDVVVSSSIQPLSVALDRRAYGPSPDDERRTVNRVIARLIWRSSPDQKGVPMVDRLAAL